MTEDWNAFLYSIIYASIRVEIGEFLILKDIILRKYDYFYITIADCNEDKKVNANLFEKLKFKQVS